MNDIDISFNRPFFQDCVEGMKEHLPDESIHLIVTSPPYFNAKGYSQYKTEEEYWDKMHNVFSECYRVLDNHRALVLNVSDVVCRRGEQSYTASRVPIVAKFITMLTEIGFEYADNIIWDKGEVQSNRTSEPYPFYVNPINCHESILIFHKHRLDRREIPCPLCGKIMVSINGKTEKGVMSWECNNPECHRSKSGRGKRFSARSIMMQKGRTHRNKIPHNILDKWRRDIIEIPPVIKINMKGENTAGHTAPFPEDIPEFAIYCFSHENDIVLDPFLGSGTTGKVARMLNRRWLGFEIYEEFKPIIRKKTLMDIKNIDEYFR